MPFWNHVIANEPTGFARCFKESTTIAIGSLEDVYYTAGEGTNNIVTIWTSSMGCTYDTCYKRLLTIE